VIRVGIVGCNFGRAVHLPAFRADQRCRVVALAGRGAARTAGLAAESGIPHGFGDWRELIEHPDVDAISIATLPELQPQIAIAALTRGKPVFAEKPLASDLPQAEAMLRLAKSSGRTTMVDFNFTEILCWRKAKEIIDSGGIGALRHVVVAWNVENAATRLRAESWKTRAVAGGGALGNFVSHCFHYLEWFCGPIDGLFARLSGLPDRPDMETNATMAISFASGASGSLAMSCASFLGSGHRVEFYGDEGALVLANPTTDYMRGFVLSYAARPAERLEQIDLDDPLDRRFSDGRIAPVSRLASRFMDAIEGRATSSPDFAAGYRVQCLLDAARRSSDARCWLKVEELMRPSAS
jgi:predicted dehydrogenase